MCYILFTVVCHITISFKMASGKHESDKQRFRLCVSPCPRFVTGGDTNSLCIVCLGAEHARSGSVNLSMRTLRSQRALFEEGSLRTRVARASIETRLSI